MKRPSRTTRSKLQRAQERTEKARASFSDWASLWGLATLPRGGSPLPTQGRLLVIGIPSWSESELKRLALVSGGLSDAILFDLDRIRDGDELRALLPGVDPPTESPLAVIYQDGHLVEAREGPKAWELLSREVASHSLRARTRYGVKMTGQVGYRLEATASILGAAATLLADLAETHGWMPQPQSIAEFDLQVDARAPDGSSWPIEAKGRVGDAVAGYAETAGGHLSTLGVLFSSGEVLYSVPVLARSVLEHASKVCWILEPHLEGDLKRPVTTRDRFARAFLEELISAEHYKKTVGRLSGKSSSTYRSVQSDWKRLRDVEIPRLFGKANTQLTRSPYRIDGEELLGLEDLTEWYSRNHVPGRARGVYDALSNFTHPTLFSVRELTRIERQGDQATRRRDVTVEFLERVTTVAVSSFYKMMEHIVAYLGWPRASLDLWADEVNEWMPDLIREAVPRPPGQREKT